MSNSVENLIQMIIDGEIPTGEIPKNSIERLLYIIASMGGVGSGGGGPTNYNLLSNKPKINGIELTGDKSLKALGIDLSLYSKLTETVKELSYTETDGKLKITYADGTEKEITIKAGGGSSYADWQTNTLYKVSDKVVNNKKVYNCLVEHTSNNFDDDLKEPYWEVYIGGGAGDKTSDLENDGEDGTSVYVEKSDIVDNVTSTDTDKMLSAYQGYLLEQKRFDNLTFNSASKEIIVHAKDGTKKSFSASDFINDILATVKSSGAMYVDKKPTCEMQGDKYITTYLKDGVENTTDNSNIWFYYKENEIYYQTIFIEGTGITIKSGGISSIFEIDEVTYNWLINEEDTGVCARGRSTKLEPNPNNTDVVYKLDVYNYDDDKQEYEKTATTQNLHGRDSVQVPLNGFYKIYVLDGNVICEVETGATPPPLAIEEINGVQCLTYTVGGTIQGTLIS